MKIPFGLHRRIPRVRRVLELLAQTTAERDQLRGSTADLQARNDALYKTLSDISAEFDTARSKFDYERDELLRQARIKIAAATYPLLYGNADAGMGETAQRMWSLMRPMDAIGRQLVRKGNPHDGGYLMVDHGLRNGVAYSLGINDDVSWDLDMAALGCEIYQYDHTIDRLPVENPRFHWFKQGIAAQPTPDGVLDSLPNLIARNGHANHTDLILKMDIEGYEWEVFESMDERTLRQFSQIVLEVHTLVLGGSEKQAQIAQVLEKLYQTHQPVHVHANNHGFIGVVGGVTMPDTLELTYVRRSDHQFTTCNRMFPSEFDMRCRRDVPDFFLGPLGSLPPFESLPQRQSAPKRTAEHA